MPGYLDVIDLNVSFGSHQVLFDINFSCDNGDFVAIAGPSGCGKTTLLRTILGLERSHSGSIRMGNSMLTTHGIQLVPEKRHIGWVPQDAALFPMLTVAENIAFSLARSPRGVKKQAQSPRVDELLSLINLSKLRNRMPHELSGGQAQRVALARALAADPKLVLMDEPFAGLDPVLRSELRAEVKSILKEKNTTALLVTHDQTEALSIADSVALLNQGRIVQYGTPQEIYTNPASVWAAQFLGDVNLLSGQASGKNVRTFLGESNFIWRGPGEPGLTFDVVMRPEALQMTDSGNWRVTAVQYFGHDALMSLQQENGNKVDVRVKPAEVRPVGELVGVIPRGTVLGFPTPSAQRQ
jgi:iron(III) transport system ATP-binding protein